MNSADIRRFLRKNPALKKWLIENEKWLEENPQALQSLLNNPSFLSTYSQTMQQKSQRIQRKTQLVEAKQASTLDGVPVKQRKLNIKLPSLTDLNDKLGHTTQLITGVQSLMKLVKP